LFCFNKYVFYYQCFIYEQGKFQKLLQLKDTSCSNLPTYMNQEGLEIEDPQSADYLVGKGNKVQYHMGNVYLRERVKEHLQDYVVCPHGDKKKVYKNIYDTFPGRFLCQNSETKTWYEIEENEALGKIAQKLRDGKKKVSFGFSLILV